MAIAKTRLVDHGFEKMTVTPISGLFVTIMGLPDMGKTTFGLTAPGPIALFDGDKGLKGVVEKFLSQGKEIYRYPIELPELPEAQTVWAPGENKTKNLISISGESLRAAQEAWSNLTAAVTNCLESNEIRTIFFDTGTVLWDLFRLSKFGKTLQVPASAYAAVNPDFTNFLNRLKKATEETRKNVILAHKMRSVYIDDKKTSRYEMAGFSGLEYISDVMGEMKCDKETHEYGIYITKCKPNGALRWDTLSGDLCTFPMLASLVTGQDLDYWS